jgi:hypothetical protein
MKTAAELACYVDMASDKPYACIEEAFEANRFASLTRRMMAEAARLELDTDPIGDVFALFCGLFCVPLPFIRPDAAFDVASWRSFCQAELARYARLEPRARAIAARVLALHDGGAPGQGKEIAGRHGMPSTTLGSVHGHTLARRYQRAWTQYTRAIQQGGFDGTPTDRDAYGWLLQNEGDLSGMPEFHTWGRYLRGARNFHGAQKNQPRHGRAHGGSVVLSKDISRLTRTARG